MPSKVEELQWSVTNHFGAPIFLRLSLYLRSSNPGSITSTSNAVTMGRRDTPIKGVGKQQPLNCLMAAHWTWHDRRGLSATMPLAFSRFEETKKSRTWLKLGLPLQALTSTTTNIIGNIEFATSKGLSNIHEVHRLHRAVQAREQKCLVAFACDGWNEVRNRRSCHRCESNWKNAARVSRIYDECVG